MMIFDWYKDLSVKIILFLILKIILIECFCIQNLKSKRVGMKINKTYNNESSKLHQ